MTGEEPDREFVDRALRRLPSAAPSSDFEAGLKARYAAWTADRQKGLWAAVAGGLRGLSQTVWPGAPVWVPASALAAALLVGAGLGAALPVATAAMDSGFSLEQPQSFSLVASDATSEEDF
jgi:hypothetical protein